MSQRARQAERTEPAMSQVTTPTEPGWLPDPTGRYEWRYWDGGWTNRVASSAASPSEAPPASPAAESRATTAGAPAATPSVAPAPDVTTASVPEAMPTTLWGRVSRVG